MLGKRLKDLRLEKEMTQQDVADILQINRVTYTQYEIDKREPDNEMIGKLSSFFDVSSDYLLGLTKTRKHQPQKVTPKEFFPPELAEEMEQFAKSLKIKKEKKYTKEEINEIAEFIRKYSK